MIVRSMTLGHMLYGIIWLNIIIMIHIQNRKMFDWLFDSIDV